MENTSTYARPKVTDVNRFTQLQSQLLAHYGVEARSRFVRLKDPALNVHVLEAGSGEPVVLLHGGDGEAVDWAPIMKTLQHEAHLFAVDRPGFGLTDPFDYKLTDLRSHSACFVVSLLDALGLESATLVGGSMGGFFTLVAALDHPDRVRGLVLVGMALGLESDAPEPLRFICGTPGEAEKFMDAIDSIEGLKGQYVDMFGVDADAIPDLFLEMRLAGLRRPGAKSTWATLLQRVGDLNGFRPEVYLGGELPKLRQPALIVWGERDIQGAEVGKDASERMPDAQFALIQDSGHFPFLEEPEETARLIAGFIKAK